MQYQTEQKENALKVMSHLVLTVSFIFSCLSHLYFNNDVFPIEAGRFACHIPESVPRNQSQLIQPLEFSVEHGNKSFQIQSYLSVFQCRDCSSLTSSAPLSKIALARMLSKFGVSW